MEGASGVEFPREGRGVEFHLFGLVTTDKDQRMWLLGRP